MGWPTSQDYNEAIQNPATSFADPDLKKGEVALNEIGLPVPRSGNFADVYEFKTPDGKKWALKLFTRKVAGLQERYAKIDEHLSKAKFPFTVGFKYMAQGIRIRGEWYPLLKMEWVEGFTLNEFVRENAGKPQYLHALMQMWGKLTALLRDADFAHADLQHGNVLLVPATSGRNLGLRLIDYDGMWVPSLAETHSGEVGHPNFQHPLRLKDRLYNADVDRFPHLVIAAALRGTLIGGKPFWDKFDNGDNLLFKESDLRDPANSPVFKALWRLNDSVLCTLVGKMALATKEPLRKTPWLDDLLLTDEGKRLPEHEEARVMQMLGVGPHFTAAKTADAPAVQEEFNAFAFEDEEPQPAARKDKSASQKALAAKEDKRPKKKGAAKEEKKSKLPLFIGSGVAAVLALVGIIIAASGGGGKKDTPSQKEVAKEEPKRETPKVVVPPDRKKKDSEEPNIIGKKDDEEPKTIGKKDDTPIEKKDPIAIDNQHELRRVWKIDRSTRADAIQFSDDNFSLFIAPPGANKIEKLRSADGSTISQSAFGEGEIVTFHLSQEKTVLIDQKGQHSVYDFQTGAKKFELSNDLRTTQAVFDAKREAIWVPARQAGSVRVVSTNDGRSMGDLNFKSGNAFYTSASSRDGNSAAFWSSSGQVFIKWKNKEEPATIAVDTGRDVLPHGIAINGRHLAIAAADHSIHVFEIATGKQLKTLLGHTDRILGLVFTESRLVSISRDKSLRVWDVEKSQQVEQHSLEGAGKRIVGSADGKQVAVLTSTPESTQLWSIGETPAVVVKKDPTPAVGAPALLKAPFTKEQAEKARAEWAKFLNIPERKELDLGKGVKMELVLIPPGEFLRGDKKKRPAAILKPFYMAVTETTQEQFVAVLGKNPSGFSPNGPNKDVVAGMDTTKFPADRIGWLLASEFSDAIKGQLPTEAQWEYACRAGTTTDFHFGDTMTEANCNGGKILNRTTAVKSYAPNAFGLYDMHGNVHEHTRRLEPNAANSFQNDPDAPSQPADIHRMIRRGGAWNDLDCRSSRRSETAQNTTLNYEGFRVIVPAPDNPIATAKLPDPEPKDIGKKEPPAQLAEIKSLWTVKHQVAHGTLVFTENDSSVTLRDARTGTIVTHAVADGKRTHNVKIPSPDAISSAIVLPNGLFFGRDNRSTGIAWDLAKDVEAFRLTGVPEFATLYPWTDKSSSTFMLPHSRGEIDIYSIKDGAKTGSIQLPPKSAVGTVAIAPDGKTIAVLGQAGEVGIRGVDQRWRQIGQLEAGKGKLRLAISPDAKQVAFNQAAGPVHVLDTATGKKKLVLSGHEGEVFRFGFTTNGRHLLTISLDRSMRMWDVQTGKELQKVSLTGEGRGLAISSDGRYAVTTTSDETVQLWQLPTAAAVKLPEPKPPVVKMNPAPMIPKGATFDAKDAGVVAKSEALSEFMRGVLFSGDGKKIFATSMAGALHILDAETLKEESQHTLSEDKLTEPAISYKTDTTPERLYVIDAKRKLLLFETENKLRKEIALDGRGIDGLYYHLRTSPDAGMLFATELNGGPQIIWDLQQNRNGNPSYIPKPVLDRLMSVAHSPDGQVGCASNAKQVAVWNAQTGEAIRTFDAPNFPKHVACCPEASAVFYYTNKDGLFAVDYQSGMPLWSITSEVQRAPVHFVGAVPNLPAIVVVREDRSVTMLDARDGKEIVKWTTANWPVVGLSPDGKYAAIGYGKIKQVFLYKLPVLSAAAP